MVIYYVLKANAISIDFFSTLQGSFSLVIDVFHENEATSNQAQDQIGKSV